MNTNVSLRQACPKQFWKFLLGYLSISLLFTLGAFANGGSKPQRPKTPNTNKYPCPPHTKPGCIQFSVFFDLLPFEDNVGSQVLRANRDEPTPAMFSSQSLSYVSVLTTRVISIKDEADLTAGSSYEFTLTNPMNEEVFYRVSSGENVAETTGMLQAQNSKVFLLDENFQPVTEDPAYLRLLRGDGSVIDYPAIENRKPASFTTASGRKVTFGDEVDIRYEDTYYRQLKGPNGLLDIVNSSDGLSYEIRFYTLANVGVKNSGGYYEPVGQPYRTIRVENPTGDANLNDQVRITETHGSYSSVEDWFYVPAANDWVQSRGVDPVTGQAMLKEQLLINIDATTGDEFRIRELRNENGDLVSREQQRIKQAPWGGTAMIEEIIDSSNFALTSTYSFYENPAESGRYSRRSQITKPDGSWEKYDYDSLGRRIQLIEPWQDSPLTSSVAQAKETTYSFIPVDALDVLDAFDERPRITVVKALGVEIERTYNVYYTDANTGEFTEIEERTTVQGAAYQDPGNLRTTRIYYADTAGAVSAGRLKSVTKPDGVVELYSYSQADELSDFIETVDHVTSSGPLAFKSTRQVMTKNARGNLVKEESFVHDGTDWQLYRTSEQDFSNEISAEGFQLIQRRKDGRVTLDQSWYGPLVGARTGESGIQYLYSYDLLDRKEMEIKVGANGREDTVTTYNRDLGSLNCSCDGQRSVARSAGGITLVSVVKTDSAGRPSERIDENGYTTTFSYVDDRRITTETLPSGATRITENYLDGRLKSVTGTAVIPEYYSYTVNNDGSTATLVEIASQGSPRYREMTYDVAGRMIKEESPAFDGSVFTREMSYDSRGLLASQSETGRADTLYEYDDLAQLIRSGIDVDSNGSLDLASTDRITDTDRFMELDGVGDWFAISSATVYPESGNSTSVEISRTKQRMSNFALATAEGDLVSENIQTDVHGNITTSVTYIDRSAKTVTQITDTPDTTIDTTRVSINGLLVSQNSSTVAAATIYDYDAVERRISVKDPRHVQAATMEYYTDSMELFTQTDGAGNTTAFTYHPQGSNGAGQIASITDPLLQKNHLSYDTLGRQIQSWGETDYPQAYSYNSYGELETLTTWRDTTIDFSTATWPAPAGGDVTTWTYQSATGLLTRKEYADSNGTDYTYDSANRLSVRTWARDGGLDTTYSYDANTGELLNVNYEAGDTADISYTYDRLGRQSTVTDATGTRSFSYNPSNLELTSETLDTSFYQGQQLTRSYEDGTETNGLTGRSSGYLLTDSASSAISAVNYAYDSSGRLQTITDGTDTFTYGYTANSNLLASLTAPQHNVSYTYEANRELMTIIDNQVSGSSLSKYIYSYDALGRRNDRQQSGSAIGTTSVDDFAYNTRSEVISASNSIETAAQWNPTYSFDQIGNRKTSSGLDSTTYTANELNQYTALSTSGSPLSTPSYDADSNLLSKSAWTYTWNNENRLINADNGSISIDFEYDYQGRLVEKDDGTTAEIYVYDGWNRIAKYQSVSNSPFTLHASYSWGLDLSGSMQDAGGVGGLLKESNRYPTYDANGNIVQKLNGSGVAEMAVEYDPFGNIVSGTLVGEYAFSTKLLIESPDWYYYGYRHYDAKIGRWANRDPIRERGGINLLSFIRNNPVGLWDYLGWRHTGCKERVTFKPVISSVTDIDVNFEGVSPVSDPKVGPPLELADVNFTVGAKVSGYAECVKWDTDCCITRKNSPVVTIPVAGIPITLTVGAGPRLPVTIKRLKLLLQTADHLGKTDDVIAAFTAKAALDKACGALFQ